MSAHEKTAAPDAESPKTPTSPDGLLAVESPGSDAQHVVYRFQQDQPVDIPLGGEGALRAELMGESWGKHGRAWVLVGLSLCMLA